MNAAKHNHIVFKDGVEVKDPSAPASTAVFYDHPDDGALYCKVDFPHDGEITYFQLDQPVPMYADLFAEWTMKKFPEAYAKYIENGGSITQDDCIEFLEPALTEDDEKKQLKDQVATLQQMVTNLQTMIVTGSSDGIEEIEEPTPRKRRTKEEIQEANA